jgi:protein-S-isoprenylcysteine O-methyltransferase Ste14
VARSQSLLHGLTILVFARLTFGAVRCFVAHESTRRDIRSSMIALSFWAMIAASYRAAPAPGAVAAVAVGGLAAALALFQWAAHSIRGRIFSWVFSSDEPQFLHTDGPYACVRNPFYASYLLALGSTAALWPSLLTASIALAMVGYFQMAARFEERKFERSALREAFAAYKARTGRLLPRWRR